MSYPTEFSSTLTYENRYDLDEIDVFFEGDGNNPMFFSIDGLPKQLTYGKHYFNLSILDPKNQQYKLRNGSRILFEFKSINGVILKSDVIDLNQRNGVIMGYVEVLQDPLRTRKEVEDGEGTLIVVGSLDNKPNTKTPIPERFRDAMNYRCIIPIQIRKTLLNASSPAVLNSSHQTETTLGQFSFIKASISTRRNVDFGMKFDDEGSPENSPPQFGSLH